MILRCMHLSYIVFFFSGFIFESNRIGLKCFCFDYFFFAITFSTLCVTYKVLLFFSKIPLVQITLQETLLFAWWGFTGNQQKNLVKRMFAGGWILGKYSLRSFLSVFLACIFRSYLTVLFVFLEYDLSIIPFFNYS